MWARNEAKQKHLAAIDKIDSTLAIKLDGYSPQTIALVHDVLQETRKSGYDSFNVADTLYSGLATRAFNAESLLKILPALQQTAKAGHDPNNLTWTLYAGLDDKAFNAQNLLQMIPLLQQALEQTAIAEHDPLQLARALQEGLMRKKFNAENLSRVLELASRYIEKGKNPTAIVAALQNKQLPPTPENIQAFKEAEPHINRAYNLLYGVESIEDHRRVSASLFKQVLATYKTKLPQMGKEAYWQWIGLHAKQLKANKTNVKP